MTSATCNAHNYFIWKAKCTKSDCSGTDLSPLKKYVFSPEVSRQKSVVSYGSFQRFRCVTWDVTCYYYTLAVRSNINWIFFFWSLWLVVSLTLPVQLWYIASQNDNTNVTTNYEDNVRYDFYWAAEDAAKVRLSR
jgi:hypothetical protein